LNTAVPSHAPTAFPSPVALLHTLHLYGAAAVAAFGWGVCRSLDWNPAPWLPLWFCGALLIFNADRLRTDPADAANVPQRVMAMHRLRGWSVLSVALAASFLLAIPLLRRDWITLALVLGGSLVCLSYSYPLLGWRLKDVPLLKTFFAPTIVFAAIVALPWLHEGPPANRAFFALAAVRAWGLLLFNMILCDLRDVEGDLKFGTLSLPAALGAPRTRWLLGALIVAIEILSMAALPIVPPAHLAQWRLLAIAAPLYLGGLLAAVRQPRSERFYEWFVEGMFFLPAIATAVT
jgi:4-hydroxybenzoate polyprenyltransferase